MTSQALAGASPTFGWTEEQSAFRDHVARFARTHLSGDLRVRENPEAFARDLWVACAEFGIHGIPIPEIYGGGGQDAVDAVIAMEALGQECADQGLLFSINAQMWSIEMPILRFGTEEQKRRYLPALCDGSTIGAHGMSEPDSGSDAFAMRTRAIREGDNYRITGSKTFVTNAPEADLFLVFATVNPKRGMWGVTSFLIERGTPGLSVGKRIEKMGLTTSPMAEVVLEDCVVPANGMLGREGQGAAIFNHSMGWERACILGTTVGALARQFETCLEYAKTRTQFGKPIGSFQLVASKIADMKLRLETSRLLLLKATMSQANDRDGALDGAMAKLYISDAAVQSGLDAIQIHGGYGYTREYDAERELRDAIGGRLYSGTSEIQRLLIARHLGLTPT
ncbi:MAG: acyl-CoA dehydrogenase family protein [Gemmatimonadaceae bacterium]